MINNGLFVSLEGLEATGKTTILGMLEEMFTAQGISCMTTREPGGIETAEDIRELIMKNEYEDMSELLLFLAARREHLVKKVKPAFKTKDVVITDRYVHTSLAYQGYAKGIGLDLALELNNIITENTMPDIIFYIDIPVETSMSRKLGVNDQNRLDKMSVDFYEKARMGYLKMANNESGKFGNIIAIDGKKPMDEIAKEIYEEIVIYLEIDNSIQNIMQL